MFLDSLGPAPRNGGFSLRDEWVWCGSVVRGEDGRYHMFASVWDKSLGFSPHWLTNSRVVRAVADAPAGPYELAETVLPPRAGAWDGRMTHNPTIHRCGGQYLLFYTGTTYTGPTPSADAPLVAGADRALEARANQRIGLAVADSVYGPWRRPDRPLLEPRPGHWDALMTTNPAACVDDDGRVLLLYKSTPDQRSKLFYGVAGADHWSGPFTRLRDRPVFDFPSDAHIEDAYVWREGDGYRMIFKDMSDVLTGEKNAGVEASSDNGMDWELSRPAKAYSREVLWNDGGRTTQGSLERPQLLIEDGRPTHAFFATADGPGGFENASDTWNLVIPLREPGPN